MRLTVAVISILIVVAAWQARGDEEDPSPWIAALGSEDEAARADARAKLISAGDTILPALRQAREAAEDRELRYRLEGVIREIGDAPRAAKVALTFHRPKMPMTVDLVNGADFRYVLRFANEGTEPVVLWPFVALEIRDADGNAVPPTRRLGRWGRRRGPCYLTDIPFHELAPGEKWELEDAFARYGHDPDLITGWQFPGPGDYTLVFRYFFDAEVKSRCPADFTPLDDPEQAWNRALCFERVVEVAFHVQ
ncbi:MAG: hypothetical protein ACYTG6_10440 [Planctomycetota bacterium]|jgi:hypothetical protein